MEGRKDLSLVLACPASGRPAVLGGNSETTKKLTTHSQLRTRNPRLKAPLKRAVSRE